MNFFRSRSFHADLPGSRPGLYYSAASRGVAETQELNTMKGRPEGRPFDLLLIREDPRKSVATEFLDLHFLDIQVLHIQRIVFDELAPGFDVFAHQRAEDDFALGDVFEFH